MENFENLERLDLFRTAIESNVLLMVLRNNKNIRHLNLGFFGMATSMDDVAIQISKTNQEIISIDMWKSHSLSAIGLMALSQCKQLEEVDFGWW